MNIHKIAELAGVSIATVSKAINGKSDISEATKQKILKIMEEQNYKPRLSRVNVSNVALFGPMSRGNHFLQGSQYFSSVMSGVGDAIFHRDYSLTLVPYSMVPKKPGPFEKFCQQRKIFGGIFVLSTLNSDYIAHLAERLPIVVVSRRFDGAPLTTVEADNETGGYEAVKHLLQLGHRNILFIVPGMNYHDHVMRNRGGERALKEAGLAKHPDSLDNALFPSDNDLGYFLRNVMQSENRPTAIFALNDHEAIRSMSVLMELGLRIPEDVSVIGYDDSSFAAHMTPALTTVFQPTYDLGQVAGNRLMQMMEGGADRKPEQIVLKDVRLVVRNSTGPVKSG